MNVFDAAKERIKFIFDNFDNVYVSFSGGKDSGVLLNLCVDHIRKNAPDRKISIFHMDYEAQYQMTTDYVAEMLSSNQDIFTVYHCCLPMAAQCATSMHQSYWLPWNPDEKEIWVRDMPENAVSIENTEFDFFSKGMWDYEFQSKFPIWLHKKNSAKRTCGLIGIRTDESLNRWRAIHSERNYHNFKSKPWTKKMGHNVFNAYPIFDWKAKDVWAANAKNEWNYNRLYDLYYQAGLNIDQMRAASPFNDCATESLKLYKAIDPNNWGKMIGRVNGVNFAGLYGGTTAMGWKSIILPSGHTWKSYFEFLLKTLPKETAEGYKKKLATSIEFWKNRGGVLDDLTIQQLKDEGVPIEIGETTNYKTDKLPVKMDYLDDTGVDNFKCVPTYKRMCICVMKNDHLCKYMGFSLTKTETERRAKAEQKFKNAARI